MCCWHYYVHQGYVEERTLVLDMYENILKKVIVNGT